MDQDTVLDWLLKGLVGVLAWLGLRLHSRIDVMEKEKVDREDLQELKDSLISHMLETRKSFADQNTILLNIVGRLPRDKSND